MFACWSVGSRRSSDQSDAIVTVWLSVCLLSVCLVPTSEIPSPKRLTIQRSCIHMQIFHHKHTGKRMRLTKHPVNREDKRMLHVFVNMNG